MINKNHTLSIALISGKGGVGKTNISLGLGYALYEADHPTMLMDCDLGLANLDVLLGLTPERNLQDLLKHDVHPQDVLLSIEPDGLDFLPAASGVPELVELDEDLRSLLFEKLRGLMGGYDCLLLDLGVGINRTVLAFAAMTHMRVVIINPEPTSLTDSFAIIKVLHSRHGITDFHVVVNMCADEDEGQETFDRLSSACSTFLGLEIKLLGIVRHDPAVREAIRRQVPVFKFDSKSRAVTDIKAIGARIAAFREENRNKLAQYPVLTKIPSLNFEELLDGN
jgi:flagellar biosynthesis protein FlhG